MGEPSFRVSRYTPPFPPAPRTPHDRCSDFRAHAALLERFREPHLAATATSGFCQEDLEELKAAGYLLGRRRRRSASTVGISPDEQPRPTSAFVARREARAASRTTATTPIGTPCASPSGSRPASRDRRRRRSAGCGRTSGTTSSESA